MLVAERVGVEPAGGRSVERSRRVVLRRIRPDEIRHRADSVGSARQLREQARKERIDPLADRAVSIEHLFRARVEEARIGVEEAHEGGEVALESGIAHHPFHLRAAARDFAQPDVVNRLRGELGGRTDARECRVDLGAAGVARQAAARGRRGKVFVGDIRAQAPQRRQHLHRRGEPAERLEERSLRGRDQLPVDLRQHAFEDRTRWNPSLRGTALHVRDLLVDPARIGRHAREELLDLARGVHRRRAQQRGEQALESETARLQCHRTVAAVPVDPHAIVGHPLQEIHGDPIAWGKRATVDGAHLLLQRAPVRLLAFDALRRSIGQPIAVAMVANKGREFGEEAQRLLPMRVEQRLDGRRRPGVSDSERGDRRGNRGPHGSPLSLCSTLILRPDPDS